MQITEHQKLTGIDSRVIACMSEWGLSSPSTNYRSFWRWVFPVNHLHWYWQPNKNNQATEHTNNNAKGGLVNSTTDTLKKNLERERTDRAWFSCPFQHPARKWSRSILSIPQPTQGSWADDDNGRITNVCRWFPSTEFRQEPGRGGRHSRWWPVCTRTDQTRPQTHCTTAAFTTTLSLLSLQVPLTASTVVLEMTWDIELCGQIIIIIITKEYDYGGVMSRGLQGHLTNEIVRRESQRDK